MDAQGSVALLVLKCKLIVDVISQGMNECKAFQVQGVLTGRSNIHYQLYYFTPFMLINHKCLTRQLVMQG